MSKITRSKIIRIPNIENYTQEIINGDLILTPKKLEKGSLCSVNGDKYEKQIHNVVKNCMTISEDKELLAKPFNIQKDEELGGSTSKNDLICNYKNKDIGIEVKKYNTPDWMQCSIKYNTKRKKWEASKRGKIPIKAREIFENLIYDVNLFDGDIPPFFEKKITHEQWISIKKNTDKWNDEYIDIPNDTIRNLYSAKNCHYIQISNGFGLYHLGNDVCNFNVPIFDIEQQIRVRTKIHSKKDKKGFCILSVTIACKPKNINLLQPSSYSLDIKDKIPPQMSYVN